MFKSLNDILYKSGHHINDPDEYAAYSPYMINRWISMYSPDFAYVVNQTCNVNWSVLQQKEMHYNFCKVIIPKSRFKKIEYIKKQKDDEKKSPKKDGLTLEDKIAMCAKAHEISVREVRGYIEAGFIQFGDN